MLCGMLLFLLFYVPIINLLDNEILKEKEQYKTLTNDICLPTKVIFQQETPTLKL